MLKLPKGIQGRLVEENRTLSMERSYLADLMSNVQKMHNDLERSGENDRRRLEGQLQMLNNQTSGDFKHSSSPISYKLTVRISDLSCSKNGNQSGTSLYKRISN